MSMSTIDLNLMIWRQKNSDSLGDFENYAVRDISTDMSFLEMIDVLNEQLTKEGKEPVAFDHDCREGICGMCGAVVNGVAHGPDRETTLCQLHMRKFSSGDTIVIEPFRSLAFPIKKDLLVDRSALDRIIQAGGYVSVNTGGSIDGNDIPIGTETAELAMDAAACIGCGACVASCPNGAAQLFVAAKVANLNLLPQGQPERWTRVEAMVDEMERYFGSCTNHGECEAACPKRISIDFIAMMNKDYVKAKFKNRRMAGQRS